MTVGELKKLLAEYSDDMKVVFQDEMSGQQTDVVTAVVCSYRYNDTRSLYTVEAPSEDEPNIAACIPALRLDIDFD